MQAFVDEGLYSIRVFCVLRHVSDPWSKTALIFELNILSLVLILICFALQICLNMMNATLAFCIVALTHTHKTYMH